MIAEVHLPCGVLRYCTDDEECLRVLFEARIAPPNRATVPPGADTAVLLFTSGPYRYRLIYFNHPGDEGYSYFRLPREVPAEIAKAAFDEFTPFPIDPNAPIQEIPEPSTTAN